MDPREEIARPVGMLITATLLLITASWVAYLAPIAIHHVGNTFDVMDSEAPPSASIVLAMPRAMTIFVVLAVPLFIWIMARSRVTRAEHRRMKLALGALIVLMALAYGLAAWAIYFPITRIGEGAG